MFIGNFYPKEGLLEEFSAPRLADGEAFRGLLRVRTFPSIY